MTSSMMLDLFFVVVFVTCVWLAARRGMFNAISGLLGSVIGLLGAFIFTPKVQIFTIKLLSPFTGGLVKRAAEGIDLSSLLSSPVSAETQAGFLELLNTLGVPQTTWDGLANAAQATGESLLSAAGQALAEAAAPGLTFVVLFLIIQFIVRLCCSILNLNIPILRSVNRLGGAVLGALTGLIMVVALCFGIWRFCPDEPLAIISRPALTQSRIGGAVCDIFAFK